MNDGADAYDVHADDVAGASTAIDVVVVAAFTSAASSLPIPRCGFP
jgi:hypothetical protein